MVTASVIQELKRPEAYPRLVAADRLRDEVGFLQTHISQLFFAGDRVYKVKKSVELGFLDFTTLELRRHFCEEEVRLNRRLAPEVYLGVVPITRAADGRLQVDGPGAAVEWAVEMVRLPERRMLSSLLERGEIDNERIHSLVTLLAGFHAAAPTGVGVDEHGSLAAISANEEENFAQLHDFTGRVLSPRQYDFLRARRRRYLETHRELFERRVREGRVREGHGDLHAANICFTDAGVIAYDCIEFNRRFRCGDVASDLAFLAMDLDYRGYPGFSKYLLRRYALVSEDAELPALAGFYKGYRAVVRGKVAALTAGDSALGDLEREELRRQAMRYLQLAAAYELPPAMILMCGLPACGKSWLAERLAGPLRAAVLHSDVRRKTLSGLAPTARVRAGYGRGLYSAEQKAGTYRSLLADALRTLRAGHSVIVDATFSRRSYRAPFVDAVTRLALPYFIVHVTAPEALIRARLEQRERDPRQASDADLGVYLRERERFEAPSEVPDGHLLEVASDTSVPEQQSSSAIDGMIELQEGAEAP